MLMCKGVGVSILVIIKHSPMGKDMCQVPHMEDLSNSDSNGGFSIDPKLCNLDPTPTTSQQQGILDHLQ